MTLPAVLPVNRYTGNGSLAAYAFQWLLPSADYLTVITYNPGTNAFAVLVKDVDYTLPALAINNPNGGTITLLAGNLAAGVLLLIIRTIPNDQTTSIRNQGEFFPYVHEDTFDRLVMQVQQLQEALDRAVKLNSVVNPALFDLGLPPSLLASAGRYLQVNATADGWAFGPQPGADRLLSVHIITAGDYQVPLGVDFVVCNINAGGSIITLPAAASSKGRVIRVSMDAGMVLVNTLGGLISGQVGFTLTQDWEAHTFISDGTNWWLVWLN